MFKLLLILVICFASNLVYAEEYPCPPNTDVCEDKDENGFCDEADEDEDGDDEPEDPPSSDEDDSVFVYTNLPNMGRCL